MPSLQISNNLIKLLNGMFDMEKNRFSLKDVMASEWYRDESNCIK
jgi:hypothetical protein